MQVFTVLDMVQASAERFPDNVALKDNKQQVTYRELTERMQRIGRHFVGRGVGKGDIVGVFQGLSVDTAVTMFGIMASGAAWVCINLPLKTAQVAHIVEDTGMTCIVTDHPDFFNGFPHDVDLLGIDTLLAGELDSNLALPRVIDRDLANLIFTSGSTGRPKGVMFTHAEDVMCGKVMAELFKNHSDDNVLCVLPFSADYGLTLLYTMMLVGGTLTLLDSFFPNDIVKALANEAITGFGAVREMWPILFGARSLFPNTDFPGLRYVSCGGGVPPRGVIQRMIDKFDGKSDIYMLYGLTEASWSTYLPPDRIKDKLGSIGVPIPNVEVYVVDTSGRPCRPGEEGELVHRGGIVAKGYWNAPEKSARLFRHAMIVPDYLRDHEKVVYSGDIVTIDQDGYYYYRGRKDDQIKVRGYRISTQDVVDAMYRSEMVVDCWIFGVPDKGTGERIVACVVPEHNGPDFKEQLAAALDAVLPPYSVPAEYLTFEKLPLTHSMKYDVSLLTRLYQEGQLQDGYVFS